MARPGPSTAELATLRAITYRISSTPTAQLPQQVPAITASLTNCKTLLSTTPASASQSSSEASVAIHKYRTLLSTLLQDRTIQGRWTAIVLIKATLEIGGWETLQKSLPWVRGLLGVLSKPDPPSSKKLCLITLTRIFVLTREFPTLVREITTPSLPAYIQACLQLLLSTPALVETILESFNQLLPRHPTMFRSYVKQLQQPLGQLLAPTPSNKLSREQRKYQGLEASFEVSEAARRLYVQFPSCVPKGASSEEWGKMMRDVVANVHRIADKVFRAVVEDWKSSNGAPNLNGHTLDDEVQDPEEDSLKLAPWSGIYAGGERLVGLLRIVKECLANPTPNVVHVQVGLIMDLLTRMFSLTVSAVAGSTSIPHSVRFNNQVSKEERENLWVILPQVHIEAMEILNTIATRFGDNISGLDIGILDQLVWVFGSEKANVQIRTGIYTTLARLLQRSGPTLPKPSIDSLATVIRKCCDDIISLEPPSAVATRTPAQGKANANKQQTTANADAFLNSPLASKGLTADYVGLGEAAFHLLPILLSSIRPQHLSDSLRTRMDRTAILTKHKESMIASVLNPPPSKKFGKPAASILPMLARSFAGDSDVEALIRPRMPVVRTGPQAGELDDIMEDEDDEEVEDEAPEEAEPGAEDHFIGDELVAQLESADHNNAQTEDKTMSDAQDEAPAAPVETSVPSSASKRSQLHDATLSPAKRVKISDDLPALPTTFSKPSQPSASPVPVVVQEEVVVRSVSLSNEATAPAGGDNEDDDDDDDFGELVMGQDSDDESDS